MSEIMPAPKDPNFMTSLERGLNVLSAFAITGPRASIAKLARQTGLSRPVIMRCLHTLNKLGYIIQHGKEFTPSPRVMRLAHVYLADDALPAIAQPVLDRLSSEFGESCSLAVLDGDEVLYVARSSGPQLLAVRLHVGSRLPLWCTSMGRVLLAQRSPKEIGDYLERVELIPRTDRTITDCEELRTTLLSVKRQGYAIVDQELEIGLRAIAVPVYDRVGGIVAALNLGANALKITRAELETRVRPKLVEGAAEILL